MPKTYNLYIDINGKILKINKDFNSLADVDYTTSRIRDKKDLLSRIIVDNDKVDVYIKDSDDNKYEVIYNNDFLSKYLYEEKNSINHSEDITKRLHKFIDKIKTFSVKNKNRNYLLNPSKIKGLEQDEIKSLTLPKKIQEAFNTYSKRMSELINTRDFYGLDNKELKKEFDNDEVDSKINHLLLKEYNNFHNLIVWVNSYRKIKPIQKEREKNDLLLQENIAKELEEKKKIEQRNEMLEQRIIEKLEKERIMHYGGNKKK